MEAITIINIGLAVLNGIYAYKMYKQEEYKVAMFNCVALGSCLPLIF